MDTAGVGVWGGVVKMEMERLSICEGNQEAAEYVQQRLIAYNMGQIPLEGTLLAEPLSVIIKEADGQIVGGITAGIVRYWKRCNVDTFWLAESYRQKGYGRTLLRRIEEIAFEKGCRLIQLNTYSFQAPEFYQKNGYTVFGVIENHPVQGQTQYFLKKELAEF